MKNYFKLMMFVLLFSTPAYADEYSDKVKELIELSNAVQPTMKMVDSMMGNLATQTINQMHQSFRDQGKVVQRDDVVELYNEYRKEFVQAMGNNLVDLLIEPYRETFTLEELDELIIMMKTPTFQKYSIKLPGLMESAQKAGEQFGLQKGQEIMMKLVAENPKFQ